MGSFDEDRKKNLEFILPEENWIYLFGKRKSYDFNLMDFFWYPEAMDIMKRKLRKEKIIWFFLNK